MSDNVSPIKGLELGSVKTDAEIAKEIAEEMREALVPYVAVMNKARLHGMQIALQIGPDGFGRFAVQQLNICKVLV